MLYELGEVQLNRIARRFSRRVFDSSLFGHSDASRLLHGSRTEAVAEFATVYRIRRRIGHLRDDVSHEVMNLATSAGFRSFTTGNAALPSRKRQWQGCVWLPEPARQEGYAWPAMALYCFDLPSSWTDH